MCPVCGTLAVATAFHAFGQSGRLDGLASLSLCRGRLTRPTGRRSVSRQALAGSAIQANTAFQYDVPGLTTRCGLARTRRARSNDQRAASSLGSNPQRRPVSVPRPERQTRFRKPASSSRATATTAPGWRSRPAIERRGTRAAARPGARVDGRRGGELGPRARPDPPAGVDPSSSASAAAWSRRICSSTSASRCSMRPRSSAIVIAWQASDRRERREDEQAHRGPRRS